MRLSKEREKEIRAKREGDCPPDCTCDVQLLLSELDVIRAELELANTKISKMYGVETIQELITLRAQNAIYRAALEDMTDGLMEPGYYAHHAQKALTSSPDQLLGIIREVIEALDGWELGTRLKKAIGEA